MKSDNLALTIAAIIIIPFACFFVFGFGGFLYTEGWHERPNLTFKQQQEIAYALGFDMLPGETLEISYYYADFWPETIHSLDCGISGIPSEEEFLARCHEDTTLEWYSSHNSAGFFFDGYNLDSYVSEADKYAAIKKVQSTVNNL